MATPTNLKGFQGLVEGTHKAPTGSIICFSHTPASQHKPGQPIILLLHGWPQTRYMWRYTIPPLVSKGHTVFVPDLPGYGESTLPTGAFADKHDRATVGSALLSAVTSIYGTKETDIVIIGHDRGARIAQRLAADQTHNINKPITPTHKICGIMILDIAPYAAQWTAGGADPRRMTKYFHWAFLAATDISTPLIQSYGGSRFCRAMIARSTGDNEAGVAALAADGALEHYGAAYERDEVVRGAALDYAAGADEDWAAEVADLEAGRKVDGMPVCVLYSERNIGRVCDDAGEAWRGCVEEGVLEIYGIGGGVGHYLPEEAAEETSGHVVRFLARVGL